MSSLSLKLSAIFITLLVAAALAVGFLFDLGRIEALEQRQLDHLRLHAERGADEVQRFVVRLRNDVLFLSGTPPVQGIRRTLEAGGLDVPGGSTLVQWQQRLQQIFLSFAQGRPEYFQLRLIGTQDGGRELVRVERTERGLRVTPPDGLARKGQRYYFGEASGVKPGSVYFSRIDLNREHGEVSVPHRPTLRAATPVHDPEGNLFGVVVVNLDMGRAFARATSYRDETESAYIADERGNLLLHPEPRRAFAFEFGTPFRLVDAFPGHEARLSSALSNGSALFEISGPDGEVVVFLTARAWDPRDPERRLVFVLTERSAHLFKNVGFMRRDSLLGMVGLLSLAIVLVVFVVWRSMRSLRTLATASKAIAGGVYQVDLPPEESGEVGSLVLAFRRMAGEVERREEALAELNRDLERRVGERTRELALQHDLQQLILESIADGVVVADREGQFLLWNGKAEQLVGSGPEQVPQERWSSHFGIFQDEDGAPVPVDELPLVRAIRGESTDNVEVYICNPRRADGCWVQVSARPLYEPNGDIKGAVAVLVDVTTQKRLQARIRAHRTELAKVGRLALSAEVASSTAHQLSQPIAAMCNYAGAASRLHKDGRLGDAELSEILERIESLSVQAGEILGKLRARIRRRERPPAPFDVNQVVESCLELFNDRFDRQGVRIERHDGEGLPMLVGDPVQLEQVLLQLMANAVEAMEGTARGGRLLSVNTGYDPAACLVVIEIGDTGPGVRAALAKQMFEPWVTDKPGALGIGLSIAQTIVEGFRGQILIKRAASGGALFRVELPVPAEAQV